MENNILHYHKELQKYIHAVERNEADREALEAVKTEFCRVFNIIKMIMISRQERYYGIFLMNFELKIDFSAYFDASVSIDTFPFCMTVNPLLIGLKSLPEMIYIFCHEIEHIVLNHPADGIKYNPQKDAQAGYKLNIAMDASINDRLTADNNGKQYGIIAEPQDAVTSEYLSDFFEIHIKPMQAFDYYFERIPDVRGRKGMPPKIIFEEDFKKGEIITQAKRKSIVCIPRWTAGNDPDECASIIRRFVSDVCNGMSDSVRGSLPGYQQEALNRLLAPPTIMWKQVLKRYIGTIPDGHRKTQLRLSRRQPERYDISGTFSDRIIKLVVAIDTSGSMSPAVLNHIMVEIFAIVGARTCEVTVIECDAEIQHIYKVRSAKDISYNICGRGGTSFTPVIEYVNSNRYFRDAVLIYFTDGQGERSVPRPLTRRNIWVLYDKYCELSVRKPYGEVLYMNI